MIKKMRLWTTMLVFAVLALPLQAGASIYLYVPGIPGEGSQPGYSNLIPLDSTSFQFSGNSLDVTKPVDTSSPGLYSALVNGTLFPAINWYQFDTSSVPVTLFETITFSNAMIVGYSVINGVNPLENWSISYQDYTITYPSSVPLPAAAWLFGSGLIGLVGVARRKAA